MLDVRALTTGTDFIVSSNSKVYRFDCILNPHGIQFILYSKVPVNGWIQISADSVAGLDRYGWRVNSQRNNLCGFKCIWIHGTRVLEIPLM